MKLYKKIIHANGCIDNIECLKANVVLFRKFIYFFVVTKVAEVGGISNTTRHDTNGMQ